MKYLASLLYVSPLYLELPKIVDAMSAKTIEAQAWVARNHGRFA